ncbi:/ / hypothetical protein / 642408:642932 Reverse [Candidatus Hepatoplasma crinochetorum]|uniref:Uncharacterized protein n=1 Tax=Candidatus Hepatoplasma crinochetorum TaxID=295596 RepID=A0A0G7ZN67_9MOLU|nr:/ / hypothetical protein / 642408:642932 Reverse [Candidatus Hepatoplasma crinochetorum]
MKIIIEKQINEQENLLNKEELFKLAQVKKELILDWKIIENVDKWNYGNFKRLIFTFLQMQNEEKDFKISYFRWNRNLEFLISFIKNRKFNYDNFKINNEFENLFLSNDIIKIRQVFLRSNDYTKQLINCFLLTKISLKDQNIINLGINTSIIENEIFFNYLLNNYFNLESKNE